VYGEGVKMTVNADDARDDGRLALVRNKSKKSDGVWKY
jgi:hypothetical protein